MQLLVLFDECTLAELSRQLVVSRTRPPANKINATPDRALTEIPLVLSQLESLDVRQTIEKLLNTFKTIWEVNDLALRIALIRLGRAMGFRNSVVMASDPRCETFWNVEGLDFSEIHLTFGLISCLGKPLSGGTNRFIELCEGFDFSQAAAP